MIYENILCDFSNEKNIAIKYSDISINYSELANYIIECESNIYYDKLADVIIVFMEKGIEIIVSILTIFYSEHIFCVLDTKTNDNTLKEIIEETHSNSIFTDKKNIHRIKEFASKLNSSINIFEFIFENKKLIINNEISCSKNFDKTYKNIYNSDVSHIIYTSGSTSKPKGILCSKTSLINYIKWECDFLNVNSNTNVSMLSAVCFEPFLRDLFVPLHVGGCICVPTKREEFDPNAFFEYINENSVNLIHIVPTMFRYLFLQNTVIETFIDYILIAGEMLYGSDIKKYFETYKRLNLYNLYGPSETTMAQFCHKIDARDQDKYIVCVGKPLPNTYFELCSDENNNEKEVVIYTKNGSHGYADRYLNQGKFSFLGNGISAFKTGDLGCIDENNNLVILGRKDNMKKVYGQKVYPEEIEGVLNEFCGVKKSIVIIKENKIIAILETAKNFVVEKFYDHLKLNLISYKIPHFIYFIDVIPLNKSGKIDRKEILKHMDDYNLKKLTLNGRAKT